MAYCIILVIFTLFLGSIVPFAQYLIYRFKDHTQGSASMDKFFFSQLLLDYDMDDLKCEKLAGQDAVSRLILNNRGWVRGPNGTVMTKESFEAKKKCEYDIELP